MKDLKALVIGGGIHGLASSIELAKDGAKVTLLEKMPNIMMGTSGATHNRAHMGYHYPRSEETVEECQRGLKYFQEKYGNALMVPHENYYLIAQNNSNISFDEYIHFCDKMKLPYKIKLKNKEFWNSKSIEGGILVPESVFKLENITKALEDEAKIRGVKIMTGRKFIGLESDGIAISSNGTIMTHPTDVIINATYAYANNIISSLGLKNEEMTRYELQQTEVIDAESPSILPGLTVMDGPFISIMPHASDRPEMKKRCLIYDATNSVIKKEDGFFLNDEKTVESNFFKMIEKGKKYYPFMENLRYHKSMRGYRPIPKKASGDSRITRIISHSTKGIYSILEGKFISAPLVAKDLVKKIKEDGF